MCTWAHWWGFPCSPSGALAMSASLLWSCFLSLWQNLMCDTASTSIHLGSDLDLRTALVERRAKSLRCARPGLPSERVLASLVKFFPGFFLLLNLYNLLAPLIASVLQCETLCSVDPSLLPSGFLHWKVVPFVSYAIWRTVCGTEETPLQCRKRPLNNYKMLCFTRHKDYKILTSLW